MLDAPHGLVQEHWQAEEVTGGRVFDEPEARATILVPKPRPSLVERVAEKARQSTLKRT
jgi:hypothetical protein